MEDISVISDTDGKFCKHIYRAVERESVVENLFYLFFVLIQTVLQFNGMKGLIQR